MSTRVLVGGLVLFAPNIDYLIHDIDAAIDNPECLTRALETAQAHIDNPYLIAACCGGYGPLADLGEITFDDFMSRLDEIAKAEERVASAREAKKASMSARRSQFSAVRHDLVLGLLDAGHAYVCAGPGCVVHTDLAVDHKHPLSRGGTDDLANLQFLCRACNSAKGRKTMEEWTGTA